MVPGGIPGRTPGQDARQAKATIGGGYNGKGWCWAQWGEGEREEWVGPGNTNPSLPRLSEFLPATAAGLSLLHSFLLQQKSVVLVTLFPNVVTKRSPNLLLEKCFSRRYTHTHKNSPVFPFRFHPFFFFIEKEFISWETLQQTIELQPILRSYSGILSHWHCPFCAASPFTSFTSSTTTTTRLSPSPSPTHSTLLSSFSPSAKQIPSDPNSTTYLLTYLRTY